MIQTISGGLDDRLGIFIVSMPVRAFLDSDGAYIGVRSPVKSVSMPVRAFLDSDGTRLLFVHRDGSVSMPVRAFLDSDIVPPPSSMDREPFQCPSGHFLIQTEKNQRGGK